MDPTKQKRTKKRGAVTAKDTIRISIPIPTTWVTPLDKGVAIRDSDRSKLAREAIREKLTRMGIKVPAVGAA